MIRKAGQVEAFIKNPDPGVKVVLIYGSDRGAIREHARALSRHVRDGHDDPMLVVSLDEDTLAKDPARLMDEASAIPMFGGNKVIEAELSGDRNVSVIENYLSSPASDALVIIESGSLKPSSKLRKLIEASDIAVTLPCFEDTDRDIQRVAREYVEQEGFKIESQALALLAMHLGSDRGVTMRELERLVLYMGPRQTDEGSAGVIQLEDVEAVIGDNVALSLNKLVDAVALGQLNEADNEMIRLEMGGYDIQRMLIGLRLHFQSLHQTLSVMQGGADMKSALRSGFKPPLHFKREPMVRQQLQNWSLRKVEAALSILHDTERQCRTTGAPVGAIGANTLLRLARAAGR